MCHRERQVAGSGKLILVEYGSTDGSKRRLGASAMSQAYDEVGDEVPDMDDIEAFKNAWEATQQLVKDGKISAGHDVSDGGQSFPYWKWPSHPPRLV